jgi:glycerophosphoryl diester phosphodiesterase
VPRRWITITSVVFALSWHASGCKREQPAPVPIQASASAAAPAPAASDRAPPRPRLAHYPKEFQVVSLRGSAVNPFLSGNSVESLQLAAREGVRFVEVDFQLTADDVLISSHEKDIEKCGTVMTLPSEVVRKCVLPGGRHVATLEQLLALPFEAIYLDLKDGRYRDVARAQRAATAAAKAVASAGRQKDVVLMMYHFPEKTLSLLRKLGLRGGGKGYPKSEEDAEQLVEKTARAGLEMVCMNAEFVSPALVRRSAELGVWHLPWSTDADSIEHWKALASAGAAGMVVLGYELAEKQVAPQWSAVTQSG